jgi:4-amino-4-deoxy-L-arabinose transferase-like glycosyltransferase
MSDEVTPLSGRARTLAIGGVIVVVAAGLLLRFWTRSGMWLDEALTVDIARLPLHQIPNALKHDGAPPLFYVLLHFWMGLFGQSNESTRALSGVFGVLTLPVVWLCAKRFAGRSVAWVALVLMASAPFAVYYATETRMYSLVILLSGCGFLALQRAVEAPRPLNLIAVALVTAALLYSQYWALYLVGVTGLWLLVPIVRRQEGAKPWPAIGAIVAGCVLFVPWVPTFLYQSKHTGTPWAAPPNFAAVINAITGFTDNQGSNLAAGTNLGRLLALIYFAMLALALFGIGLNRGVVELDLHTQPKARGTTFIVVGTLFAAIAGGILTESAYSPRYASVVFLPLIVLVAFGTATLLNPKVRMAMVVVAVAAGLFGSAQNVVTQRTQAVKVDDVLNVRAQPGDVVAFCPDQLGPSVYRVLNGASHLDLVTFPRGTGPERIDWVDYSHAVQSTNPATFAAKLAADAGPGHHVWMVWMSGYQTYSIRCEQVTTALLAEAHGVSQTWVSADMQKYYEPMNLTEYTLPGS